MKTVRKEFEVKALFIMAPACRPREEPSATLQLTWARLVLVFIDGTGSTASFIRKLNPAVRVRTDMLWSKVLTQPDCSWL